MFTELKLAKKEPGGWAWIALAPVACTLLLILLLQPFLGTSDDWSFLKLIDEAERMGFWQATFEYVRKDVISWGMVRPYFPYVSYALVSLGLVHPVLLYLATWLIVSGCVGLLALAFAKLYDESLEQRAGLFLAAFFAAFFLWPWNSDLFQITAMQEKWVLLLGAVNLLWLDSQSRGARRRVRPTVFYPVTGLLIALGFMMKAQFVIFVPPLVVLLAVRYWQGGISLSRTAFLAAVSFGCIALLQKIASHGEYTGRMSIHNIPSNLRVPQYLALLAIALAWPFVVVMLPRLKRVFDVRPRSWNIVLWWLPSLFALCFLAIFLQWRYGGYLMAGIGFAPAMMLALLIAALKSRKARLGTFVALCVCATLVTGQRLGKLLGVYGSIGDLMRSEALREVAASKRAIRMSCGEGALAIQIYAKKFAGLDIKTFGDDVKADDGTAGYVLGDEKMCPMPALPPSARLVWKSPKPNSLRLLKLN